MTGAGASGVTRRVLLIRHGMTQGNARHAYIGLRTDESLSGQGREEASLMRPVYEKVLREAVLMNAFGGQVSESEEASLSVKLFSGFLARARETAELLFPELSLEVCPDLSEMDFGCFEGKNYRELSEDPATSPLYQAWIDSNCTSPIPGGESRADFCARTFAAFCRILSRTDETELPVLVCHGGNLMAILEMLTGEDYYSFSCANLEGFLVTCEVEDESIRAVSYDRVHRGNDPRSDRR